jgi:MTH538 TIR-like domain (DUF1863)
VTNPFFDPRPFRPTRRKVFISYHHRGDQACYDAFSRHFCDTFEAVRDNSVDRIFDSGDADYVMRKIREDYLSGTSCTIVLCGPLTPWRKYVDWEIKATLDKAHGLIGVILPNNPPSEDGSFAVPYRLFDNILSGYAPWVKWEALGQGADHLQQLVEIANSRSKILIVNSRPMRERNG